MRFGLGFAAPDSYIRARDGASHIIERVRHPVATPDCAGVLGRSWREEAGAALRLPAVGLRKITAGRGLADGVAKTDHDTRIYV